MNGYTASFDSGRISCNDDVLMAYRVNDEWLAEKHFPLQLVGLGLEKSQMVGQVAHILLSLPAEADEAPAAEAPAGDAALAITGAVEQDQTLSLQTPQAMEVVEIRVEHPKTFLF
jgi:hypothetical protein